MDSTSGEEEDGKSNIASENQTTASNETTGAHIATTIHADNGSEREAVKNDIPKLPKSLTEIYGLSNFNRKNRNRDRKRNRASIVSNDATLIGHGSSQRAEELYFSKRSTVTTKEEAVQDEAVSSL